jgi:hypothetical protein
MEISRQRLGNSLAECVFQRCRECSGRGRVRSFDLTAVAVLKAIREEISFIIDREIDMIVDVGTRKEIIMDLMNNRKQDLAEIEQLFGIKINLRIDESASLDTFYIERRRNKAKRHTAPLSSIDRTYYFSDEKNNVKKKYEKKINIAPAAELEPAQSAMTRVFQKIMKTFR